MKKNELKEMLRNIINNEDSKNPYTDLEIANKLNISRSEVLTLRKSLAICDSRERRKKLLVEEVKNMLKEEKKVSIRYISSVLNDKGYQVSRNLVFNLIKEIKENKETVFINDLKECSDENKDITSSSLAFSGLIGAEGSLKPQIELAKAAILYPENGLHTLLHGQSGVGKSEMAECMYRFAIESETKSSNSPFIIFNCADYADNPQLLLSQLFGYKKGAFTGAADDKAGLVEKANNGILFLDEIHRLPPEGQEIFFHLIDKNSFRRLGETENYRIVNILLIAATTENIESSLLSTFKRRIPMIIKLPAVADRPFTERYKIIENFFKQEAIRMDANIIVSENVVKALMLYEPSGNIGQIRSDIQVTCAKSFLKLMRQQEKILKIDITELPILVVKNLLKLNLYRDEIDQIVKKDMKIFNSDYAIEQNIDDNTYIFSKEIYNEIEDKYKIMKYQGIDEEIINRIIENELETKIYKSISCIKKNKHKLVRNDLERIVGNKIINVVEKMIFIAKEYYLDIDDSLFYCLATHLSVSYERLLQNKFVQNPKLEKIKQQYKQEFDVAKQMAELAEYYLKVNFPEDEIGFVAMYIRSCSSKESVLQNHVGVIVLSHGTVAEGMVSVANRLLGVEHAKAIEMSLDESPDEALRRTIQIAKEMNCKKGILFLVDMGSLVSFSEIIGKELSIKTRIVSRVDTIMVIEAVRKAMMPDSNLDDIADLLELDKNIRPQKLEERKEDVIVSVCLTGEGTAKILANLVGDRIKKIEVITISALENYNISSAIEKISNNKRIIYIIGTINPKIPSIPFMEANEIIDGKGLTVLENYICLTQGDNLTADMDNKTNVLVDELIYEKTTILNSNIKSSREAIEKMADLLYELDYVTEEYKESVYKREEMMPTFFMGGVAIPHGNPKYVKKSVIGILTLEEAILWDDNNYVDSIFIVAINEYYKEEFRKLYKLINDKYFLNMLKESKSFNELKEVIRNV